MEFGSKAGFYSFSGEFSKSDLRVFPITRPTILREEWEWLVFLRFISGRFFHELC
jgi:hypothetical protein